MGSRITSRLSFANVVSVLALFVALGGTAWAATALPPNSVGTKQLKNQAVTTAKIHRGAITTPDLKFPLASAGTSSSTPVSLNTGQSADVAKAALNFTHAGNALSMATVELRAGKSGAIVSLTIVHNQHTHPLGTIRLGPNAANTEAGLLKCNGITGTSGANEFRLRVTVSSGSVDVLQRYLTEVALPSS